MQRFRDYAIRRKLTVVTMLASSLALLLACGAFMTYELVQFRRATAQKLTSMAEIVATNSTSALAFNDQASAEETLTALKGERHIVSACIYGDDGKVFAKYVRRGVRNESWPARPLENSHR